ncbi:MAG: UTP--glucose-1-phosphate uridylyltransferase [Leptospiraceae bacterium]|nr:UTP--glucose-1-phosphate uridylyltransferase [Leptospiraceae bacterium]MCK6380793.1 UTP--glucose-1-phosphate uridylyltransferase [Leptospiraceae bacterium]NUM40490.1 UTP--glucose-1-phosphate uridylyltransferase [Leptospiraceae bacterium]
MKKENLSDALIFDFLQKVTQVQNGETGKVNWSEVGDLIPDTDEKELSKIHSEYSGSLNNLKKLVVIKLNGGLGTSMGLSYAKSLIEVKEGFSFLSIIAKQIKYIREKFGVEVPLILMDSYNTQKDSSIELKKIGFTQNFPISFLQNKVPRILKDSLLPVSLQNSKEEWCPPGHGDIYLSLKETGLLKKLLESGYEYAFISNGDNLGATVDPYILEYFIDQNLDFAMEMTPKTLADTKGGAIYRKLKDGKFLHLELLETAQVPEENEDEFSGLGKFRTFSTNNLWINLRSLDVLLQEKSISLSLIVNPKVIEGQEVLQLESAMGSAIGNFSNTKGIVIPRDRFAPVKKCEDYLIRRSDAYILNEDYSLAMSPVRKELGLSENIVILDDTYYKKMKDFEKLFRVYPSLIFSKSLKVEGEVEFDTFVVLKGDVKIINKTNRKRKISEFQSDEFSDESITFSSV